MVVSARSNAQRSFGRSLVLLLLLATVGEAAGARYTLDGDRRSLERRVASLAASSQSDPRVLTETLAGCIALWKRYGLDSFVGHPRLIAFVGAHLQEQVGRFNSEAQIYGKGFRSYKPGAKFMCPSRPTSSLIGWARSHLKDGRAFYEYEKEETARRKPVSTEEQRFARWKTLRSHMNAGWTMTPEGVAFVKDYEEESRRVGRTLPAIAAATTVGTPAHRFHEFLRRMDAATDESIILKMAVEAKKLGMVDVKRLADKLLPHQCTDKVVASLCEFVWSDASCRLVTEKRAQHLAAIRAAQAPRTRARQAPAKIYREGDEGSLHDAAMKNHRETHNRNLDHWMNGGRPADPSVTRDPRYIGR